MAAEQLDPDTTGNIPGLPIVDAPEVAPASPERFSGRAVVRQPEAAAQPEQDASRDDGGRGVNRMFVMSMIGGVAAVCLVVGAVVGGALTRRNDNVGAPFTKQPGVEGALGDAPTPSPTPTATPTPSPKTTPSPDKPTTPAGTTAAATTTAPAGPNYNGKIIVGSNGESYYVDSSGVRHHIANAAVSACISVRRGAGAPVPVPDGVVGGIPGGAEAYCPYELNGSGTINFVTEAGSGGFVWLVVRGVKHHVGALCPSSFQGYPYEVHQVPAGETAGHSVGSDWFGDDQTCGALPS